MKPRKPIGITDEWLTPPEIIKALGSFDLDPCSPINRPWDTASRHLTIEDDGLSSEWHGRVWMNPPYGKKTGRWLAKLARHGNGIALITARTETKAFFNWGWDRAHAMLFFRGRLHFYRVNGIRAKGNAGAPSVLIAYGESNAVAILNSGIAGRFVRLKKFSLPSGAIGGGE